MSISKKTIKSNSSQEIWKDIEGYKGVYKISNKGRVLSLERMVFNKLTGNYNSKKERILRDKGTDGYPQVKLCNNGKEKTYKVHRLVAKAFIPLKEGKRIINHKNGDRSDNRVENLEWCSSWENSIHASLNSDKRTSKYPGVSINRSTMRWKAQIRINGKNTHLGYFKNEFDAYLKVLETRKKTGLTYDL